MALKDIISNAELKDDATIKIGDQEYNVGELRAELSAPPEGYIPRAEFDRQAAQMGEMTQSVQALLAAAAKQTDAAPGDAPTRQDPKSMLREALSSLLGSDEYDYEADKYVGPAMKKAREQARDESLKGFDERFNPVKEKLEKDVTGLTKRLALAEGRAWYRQAKSEIPENPQTKKPYSLQEIAGLAFQHKILDNDGWPDYDAVLDRMTAPKRQQTEIEKAREEGRKEGIRIARDINRQNLIGMPGGRSARIGETKPPIDTSNMSPRQMFDAALGAAVQDPEVMGDVEEA
ncbi:MAG: hypothetical protein ACYDCQ_17920 [Dehalococcoidia bacterium]